jgi:hypothetical protein
MAMVHSLFDGRADDIEIEVLFPDGVPAVTAGAGVLDTGSQLADTVKEALADHYDRPLSEFSSYEVVVEPEGDVTVRPPAKFGV